MGCFGVSVTPFTNILYKSTFVNYELEVDTNGPDVPLYFELHNHIYYVFLKLLVMKQSHHVNIYFFLAQT